MASAAVELKVFNKFRDAFPKLGIHSFKCAPGPNPPDFICVAAGGARIGVELSEWLDEQQIAHQRPQYQREHEFLRLIDSRSVEPPTNIGNIWVFEHEGIRLRPADSEEFKKQLYAFVRELDRRWSDLEGHDDSQGLDVDTFPSYPMVAKYLGSLRCWSQATFRTHAGNEWMSFMPHGGGYDEESAFDALKESLARKTAMYTTLHKDQNLAELHLLLYYDQGFLYNTPFDVPDWGFNEIAAALANVAAQNHGVFDHIYLFILETGDLAVIY